MKSVIGIDYGTDSCRALIVDAATGREIASSVSQYRRWKEGRYCDPSTNQYRQHPLDYVESLEEAVHQALAQAPKGTAADVAGISFDTTGCTPSLVNSEGTPLALMPEHAENPNAMFVLWKDHTAIEEAAHINRITKLRPVDYTMYEGGIYSSEWVWAKMAHVLKKDENLRRDAYSWIEHCDWMPALLTGRIHPKEVVRGRCAAGHKAMWAKDWGGLPPTEFLADISTHLAPFRARLYAETFTNDTKVGTLSEEWAKRLGLNPQVAVGVGMFDCHAGAVGAEIRAKTFVRVIGTSTCDIMVASKSEMHERLIPGICGQVDGSVIPGMIGLEAGQSGFGDVYAWFARFVNRSIEDLSAEAEKLPVSESLISTDWLNGRRTPDANQALRGAITGLTLGSTPAMVFRSLVEATAYGSKAIVDRFIDNGLEIDSVIGIGGISQKSPFVMQTLADVLGMPIKIAAVEQACAFGAAIFASVVAGIHPNVEAAQKAMGQGFLTEYQPDPAKHSLYKTLYQKYLRLGKFTEDSLTNQPK
jgi:L-ribulokinase